RLADKPVTFQLTGPAIPAGRRRNRRFPYPVTENWQKAIGAHYIWMSANVTVAPAARPNGKPRLTMHETLHAQDRYNFNPGMKDIATSTRDAENGRFQQVGLAKQYENSGTSRRNVAWDLGDLESGVVTGGTPPGGGRR